MNARATSDGAREGEPRADGGENVGVQVLVVDDEPAVRAAVSRALSLERYTVSTAADGEQALALLERGRFDAVVLDVLLPGIDGMEVCRRLRARGDETPVLMLTARTEVADRVSGLDAGADDYLVKPFALEELLARLRSLLRRRPAAAGPGPLRFADLVLDVDAWSASRNGRPLRLTKTELALLELFLTHPRQVLTRAVLTDNVWDYDFGPSSNSLEVYVSYLRKKTEAGGEPRLIHTVRGVGYVLREPDEEGR